MLKEAIDRILELAVPNTIAHNGLTYVDKPMRALQPPADPLATALDVNTLTAIRDYINNEVDGGVLEEEARFVIHVEDYNDVRLYKELNKDRARECFLFAHIDNCAFPFGRFMDLEAFIINLQAHFVRDSNVEGLLRLVGNIVSESGVTHADDGYTQRVTTRTGIALVGNKEVPNPILLRPYRTFTEIEQPESAFVVRIRKDGDAPVTCALFEADGQAWKHDAIQGIARWLGGNISVARRDEYIILA